MIVWIIGLSGAGKTTLGKALYQRWKKLDRATVFIDGDDFRQVMGDDLGHSYEDREKNGRRLTRLCHLFDSQGINAVVCVLSNYPEHQKWNRDNYSEYLEIFIDTPIETLKCRDPKGIYKKFEEGSSEGVVGLDIPFVPPSSPDMTFFSENNLNEVTSFSELVISRINKSNASDHD